MSQKNKTDLASEVSTEIIPNNNGQITAAQLQGILLDYIDSFPNWLSDTGRLGLKSYNPATVYQGGDCCISPTQEIVSALGVTSGTFDPGHWFPMCGIVSKRSIIMNAIQLSNSSSSVTLMEYSGVNAIGATWQCDVSLLGLLSSTDTGVLTITCTINGNILFTMTYPPATRTNEVIEFRAMLTHAMRASGGGLFQFIGAATLESSATKIKIHSGSPITIMPNVAYDIQIRAQWNIPNPANNLLIDQGCFRNAYKIDG